MVAFCFNTAAGKNPLCHFNAQYHCFLTCAEVQTFSWFITLWEGKCPSQLVRTFSPASPIVSCQTEPMWEYSKKFTASSRHIKTLQISPGTDVPCTWRMYMKTSTWTSDVFREVLLLGGRRRCWFAVNSNMISSAESIHPAGSFMLYPDTTLHRNVRVEKLLMIVVLYFVFLWLDL